MLRPDKARKAINKEWTTDRRSPPRNISQNFKKFNSILCRHQHNQIIHLNSIIQVKDTSYHKNSTNSKGQKARDQENGRYQLKHASSTRNIPNKKNLSIKLKQMSVKVTDHPSNIQHTDR